MTDIVITNYGERHTLTATNHADDQVVCAGITAIVYALAGAVINRIEPNVLQLNDGAVIIDVETDDLDVTEDFLMAYIGLEQIRRTYPDKLKVQYNNL